MIGGGVEPAIPWQPNQLQQRQDTPLPPPPEPQYSLGNSTGQPSTTSTIDKTHLSLSSFPWTTKSPPPSQAKQGNSDGMMNPWSAAFDDHSFAPEESNIHSHHPIPVDESSPSSVVVMTDMTRESIPPGQGDSASPGNVWKASSPKRYPEQHTTWAGINVPMPNSETAMATTASDFEHSVPGKAILSTNQWDDFHPATTITYEWWQSSSNPGVGGMKAPNFIYPSEQSAPTGLYHVDGFGPDLHRLHPDTNPANTSHSRVHHHHQHPSHNTSIWSDTSTNTLRRFSPAPGRPKSVTMSDKGSSEESTNQAGPTQTSFPLFTEPFFPLEEGDTPFDLDGRDDGNDPLRIIGRPSNKSMNESQPYHSTKDQFGTKLMISHDTQNQSSASDVGSVYSTATEPSIPGLIGTTSSMTSTTSQNRGVLVSTSTPWEGRGTRSGDSVTTTSTNTTAAATNASVKPAGSSLMQALTASKQYTTTALVPPPPPPPPSEVSSTSNTIGTPPPGFAMYPKGSIKATTNSTTSNHINSGIAHFSSPATPDSRKKNSGRYRSNAGPRNNPSLSYNSNDYSSTNTGSNNQVHNGKKPAQKNNNSNSSNRSGKQRHGNSNMNSNINNKYASGSLASPKRQSVSRKDEINHRDPYGDGGHDASIHLPQLSTGKDLPQLQEGTGRDEDFTETSVLSSSSSSEAVRQILKPSSATRPFALDCDESGRSYTERSMYSFAHNMDETTISTSRGLRSILPQPVLEDPHDPSYSYVFQDATCRMCEEDEQYDDDVNYIFGDPGAGGSGEEDDEESAWFLDETNASLLATEQTDSILFPSRSKKSEWLWRMNRRLQETPEGTLDPATLPVTAVMNALAKTKSVHGASLVEQWLKRIEKENSLGNNAVDLTTKMYTMAVDAWARSGDGGAAAQRAEALLQHLYQQYKQGGSENLLPTNAIFNAVINAWARSREAMAPVRAEQILNWMQNLGDLGVKPDKYTFNTVIHAWAKAGGTEAAVKAQELLARMHKMYKDGNTLTKPDTISYNVVINAWAKSGGKSAAAEAEKLLAKMHHLYESGDPDIKPNVVTYGAVIDSFAKSGEPDAAARADALLANMIQLHQSDPVRHADLLPNTYVFNTVINCWAKNKERDAASKAEEMLVAMNSLHASGMSSLKPDNFTYTAVIDAWAKSGCRGAAARADQLLDKMEAKYSAGDKSLKPNSYTYNAVICALAKSGETGAAARAERVLQNMVNRHRSGGDDDVKPTTINFNTVLDAWAKSGGGRAAAERAEEILEWMDHLHQGGNSDVKVDTISFNAVLDAWARSGDRAAPRRAEQILDHMDELYRQGNKGVKPDRYTYNTLINVWAKSGERGAAARAENVLSAMEKRFRDGEEDFKPNTRTYTSVIDAWAKSGEKGAAMRAEQILNNMITRFDATGDLDVKPNVHTANAVCNACAFSKHPDDREEALQIAFRVFEWLDNQSDMKPDSYTYTILLSVCSNLLPRDDNFTRFSHARLFFDRCREAGFVNDYVLRKLRQTVGDDNYSALIDYRNDTSAATLPSSWTRNAKLDANVKGRKGGPWSNRRRGR